MAAIQDRIIETHERKLKLLSERLSGLYGDENRAAHDEIARRRRILGRLYLARDRERRPEIYR